jgi:2-keto-4-pentenoate hydratase/2-oxohepta-3-ene-1,7-dioic acid hydratase in catechol pathway
MRTASYTLPDGTATWGVEIGDRVHDLGPSGAGLAASLKDAVVSGVFGTVTEAQAAAAPSAAIADVTFLPPIGDPGKIFCIGVNYHAHRVEGGRPEAEAPTVFVRFADTQIGHLAPALRPSTTEKFDYEGELAIVIGRGGRRIPAAEAYDHIAGYANYNDFSVRDWQRHSTQWIPGKNFPGTGGFGPWLVPAADIADITAARLQCRVNGEVRQDAYVDQLIFDIPAIIEYVSGFTPLSPGDVIVTGTPGGVGLYMEPSGLIHEGDVVEVEITGLGILRNTVVQER